MLLVTVQNCDLNHNLRYYCNLWRILDDDSKVNERALLIVFEIAKSHESINVLDKLFKLHLDYKHWLCLSDVVKIMPYLSATSNNYNLRGEIAGDDIVQSMTQHFASLSEDQQSLLYYEHQILM